MTNITASELKMLYIEVIMVAIVGVFMFLYSASPISEAAPAAKTVTSGSSSSEADLPWSTSLVDSTLGLPVGYSAIIIVSSIFLVPMTIMNALTLARLAKDFLTQWV